MSVTVGLEVMTHGSLSVAQRRLDADAVSNQTDHMAVAGLTRLHRLHRLRVGAGRGSGQLNGVIYTEVLQLYQLTFRHPDVDSDTDMSSGHWLSIS